MYLFWKLYYHVSSLFNYFNDYLNCNILIHGASSIGTNHNFNNVLIAVILYVYPN